MVLERFFAWLDRCLGTEPPSGLVSRPGTVMPPRSRPARERSASMALFSVDGAGQFLLCGAERLTLGHLRAGQADLGFMADVGALHATLVRADSLHEGPGWRIQPCGDERVSVAGETVAPEGRRFAPGARVGLGQNLELRLEIPDPASASAVLVLARGAECAGARRIVLMAPGPGGRVRIGASSRHHVRVPGLEFELALEWRADGLELTSELELAGALTGSRGRLGFPPSERLAFTCGKPRGSRPPFGCAIEPVWRERTGAVDEGTR